MVKKVIANWKMNKTVGDVEKFIQKLIPCLPAISCDVWLAPAFTAIQAAVSFVKGSKIKIGAQTMSGEDAGAFTGEISGKMLKEAGAEFVILGHSERRLLFQEKNSTICQKLKKALEVGLKPILCVGERLEERSVAAQILQTQLEECLQDIPPFEIMLAYEPVWAIGTGKSASVQEAALSHRVCLDFLEKKWGKVFAEKASLIYGGSVTPETVQSLLQDPLIHGVLVGGASLDVDKFIAMLQKVSL